MQIKTENWGEVPYLLAHQKQKKYLQEIIQGMRLETIILCTHPPVVTLGKQSQTSQERVVTDIKDWTGETYFIERGGRATYHGPGQVICYPLINLKNRGQKLAEFLNALEQATVKTLNHYGVAAEGNPKRGNPKRTGVHYRGRKIASVGIAVKSWVTYHGLACNLYHDPLGFQGINPCGLESKTMTSLEEIIGQKVERRGFEKQLIRELTSLLPPLTSVHTATFVPCSSHSKGSIWS